MKYIIYGSLCSLLLVGCTGKTITIGNKNPRVQIISTSPVYTDENYPSQNVPVQNRQVYQSAPLSHSVYVEPQRSNVRQDISVYDAYDEMYSQEVTLLDVREPNELISDGRIAKSILIPLGTLSRNMHKLDKNKRILVYCHTGNRSVEATEMLMRAGYDAANIKGGIKAWKAAHLPVKYKR